MEAAMTNRTASLLLLFVMSLIVTGVLLALTIAAMDRAALDMGVASGPWLAPIAAVVCQTSIFYVGRHHILPHALAAASARAAVVLIVVVTITMTLAVGSVWLLQQGVGGRFEVRSVALPIWFALLWFAVCRQQIWHGSLKTGVR